MNNLTASLRTAKYAHFRKRFYRKSLVTLLLAICLPTVIVGIGVKWIGTNQLERIVLSSRDYQVTQSAKRADDYLSYIERTATQWAFNPEFGSKLRSLENNYDYTFIRSIYTNLLLLQDASPLIDKVYLYLDKPGIAFTGSEGTLQLKDQDKARFHELLGNSRTTYWLPSFVPPNREGSGMGTITLVYQLPADITRPAGALLIYLHPEQVARMLGGAALDENGAAFLYDEAGEEIGSANGDWHLGKSKQEIPELVGSKGGSSGSFVQEWDNKAYSITFNTFKRLGQTWTYVTVDSLSQLNSPVVAASNFVFMLGLAGLLIAAAIAVFVSLKLYQPIRTLMRMFNTQPAGGLNEADELGFISERWRQVNMERKDLKERLDRQIPAMKEGFLMQLLQGHFQASKQSELEEKMQLFGWDTRKMNFAVLGIHFHGPSPSQGRFRKEDHELISFASFNIAEEILQESGLNGEIINFHDLSIGILLGCPPASSRGEFGQELVRLADRLADTIYRFVQTNTTLCISSQVQSVLEIPSMWDEVKRIVRYRNLNEPCQVLNAGDFPAEESPSIRYPFATEAELLFAIRNLDEKEALRVLRKFIGELKVNTTREYLFQQGMFQLYGNLQFGFLKAGYNPFEAESADIREALKKLGETQDIVALFLERIIKPFISNIRYDSEKQDYRIKQAIEQTMETIQAEYDTDLSLDRLAEAHRLTPLTLSKSFKRRTGSNFTQYVTDIRIRKSKELLAESDYKINDIAEMVGYQATYFNRIFKKHEGITPSQYREKLLEDEREGRDNE